MVMSTAYFKVAYDGPALSTGRMDVKELAPALLAIGAVIEEGHKLLNPSAGRIMVSVKSFHDGSFGISFDVIQTIFQQAIDLFSGDTATAAANLIAHIGFAASGGMGLYKLIKKTKGKRPCEIEELLNGNIRLHFLDKDIDAPEIDSAVFTLYRDARIRKEIEKTIKPLEQDGIESFQIYDGDEKIDQVLKDEALYYHLPPLDEQKIGEQETVKTFSIHSLSFKEANKWRLSDGTNTFFVTISDQNFLESVDQNQIAFSKGDLLKVRLIERSWETESGLKTDYEAIEILDHRKSFKQRHLI